MNGLRRAAIAALMLALHAIAPARAELFLNDAVPGATLLLPYFDADLDDPNGDHTIARVYNSVARPVVVHVTLWTDLAVPTLAFDVVLDPYGFTELYFREIFAGRLPASPPEYLAELHGVTFTGCSERFLEPAELLHIRAAHTGQASGMFGRRCAGLDHGDNVARGFATIDVLANCAGARLPTDPAYFDEGASVGASNILWGYFVLLNRGRGEAAGDGLVALEGSSLISGNTFYSRFAASDANDGRERLSQFWGAPIIGGANRFNEVILWRDPDQVSEPFECDESPAGFPLAAVEIALFDDDGDFSPLDLGDSFGAATSRVRVGAENLPSGLRAGNMQIALPDLAPIKSELNGVISPGGSQGILIVLHHSAPAVVSAQRGIDLRIFP